MGCRCGAKGFLRPGCRSAIGHGGKLYLRGRFCGPDGAGRGDDAGRGKDERADHGNGEALQIAGDEAEHDRLTNTDVWNPSANVCRYQQICRERANSWKTLESAVFTV